MLGLRKITIMSSLDILFSSSFFGLDARPRTPIPLLLSLSGSDPETVGLR